MLRFIGEVRAQEHLDEITAPPWKADVVQGQTTILSSSHRPLVVPWGDIRHEDASIIEEAPDLAWTVVVLCKAARALAGLDPTVIQGVRTPHEGRDGRGDRHEGHHRARRHPVRGRGPRLRVEVRGAPARLRPQPRRLLRALKP